MKYIKTENNVVSLENDKGELIEVSENSVDIFKLNKSYVIDCDKVVSEAYGSYYGYSVLEPIKVPSSSVVALVSKSKLRHYDWEDLEVISDAIRKVKGGK